MIQLSILKITEYGPWTLTLGSDREHELQMLQASLYKQVQKLFSEKNCLAFLNRSDEFFVVSNGLTLDDHIEIQKTLEGLQRKNVENAGLPLRDQEPAPNGQPRRPRCRHPERDARKNGEYLLQGSPQAQINMSITATVTTLGALL